MSQGIQASRKQALRRNHEFRLAKVVATLAAAFSIVLVMTAAAGAWSSGGNSAPTTGVATTTHHVKPTVAKGKITSCPAGTTTFINTYMMKPGDKGGSYSSGGTIFTTTVDPSGKSLNFTTNSPSFTVYIAGESAYSRGFRWWGYGDGKGWWGYDDDDVAGYNTFDYTGTAGHPNYSSDTGLHAPTDEFGKLAVISYYIVCGQPATVSVTPSLSTTTSAGGAVGTVVLNDTASLSGGSSPTGSIVFDLYVPGQTCGSGAPAFTQTVTVLGNGSYSSTNTTAADLIGTWSWTATYSGNAGNKGVASPCGSEPVSVSMASPTLATTPSSGGTAGSVVLNDTGILSGGYNPSGSVTFNLWSPTQTSCTGTPTYTQSVTVSGNGSYSTTNASASITNTAGTWNWTASYGGDTNNKSVTTACGSESVTVTPSSVVPTGSCEGTGSISEVASGKNVVAYVPKGNWGGGATGIDVVNVEGTSITNTQVATGTDVINSCASNSTTGQTVCTANNNDVWVLKGTALDPSVTANPLTDGGSGDIGFSGGSATTTGVAMDAVNNRALLGISIGGVGGYQFLDLATDTFEAPFKSQDPGGEISEDPLLDPVHDIIGSAAEDNNFEIVNVKNTTSPQFYEQSLSSTVTGALDSTSEDCSTGILISPAEDDVPSGLEIADIQNSGSGGGTATFTSGSPGSWTAPEQFQTLTGSDLSAGASGSAVAQGTHIGVVAGEFGGDGLTALALPTTSGAGAKPSVSNWVSCEAGNDFSMGDDPHTLAAYQSPNGGDAIALMVNDGATEMVRVDLTQMLNPATVPVTGNVCNSTTLSSTVESFIPLP